MDIEFFQACVQWPEEFLKLPKERWVGGIRESKIQTWLEKLSAALEPKQFESILEEIVQSETDEQLLASASTGLFREEQQKSADLHFFP